MDGPDSSYSSLVIHMEANVEREETMEPPIQTENILSGGATTLTDLGLGARAVKSLVILSPMPSYMVEPPDRTIALSSPRLHMSHFMMELTVTTWIPLASLPRNPGWNRPSGQTKRSLPTEMVLPSGSS